MPAKDFRYHLLSIGVNREANGATVRSAERDAFGLSWTFAQLGYWRAERNRWFAEEIQPHEFKLRNWLRHRFPWLTDVDDLVQESYARLVRAKSEGRIAHPKSYLFTTARNAALDQARRNEIVAIESVADLAGRLPKNYTLFGQVTKGLDVVDQIVGAPRDGRDLPHDPVAMTAVTIHQEG